MWCRAINVNWQVKQAFLALQSASGAQGRNTLDTIAKSGYPLVRGPACPLQCIPDTAGVSWSVIIRTHQIWWHGMSWRGLWVTRQ